MGELLAHAGMGLMADQAGLDVPDRGVQQHPGRRGRRRLGRGRFAGRGRRNGGRGRGGWCAAGRRRRTGLHKAACQRIGHGFVAAQTQRLRLQSQQALGVAGMGNMALRTLLGNRLVDELGADQRLLDLLVAGQAELPLFVQQQAFVFGVVVLVTGEAVSLRHGLVHLGEGRQILAVLARGCLPGLTVSSQRHGSRGIVALAAELGDILGDQQVTFGATMGVVALRAARVGHDLVDELAGSHAVAVRTQALLAPQQLVHVLALRQLAVADVATPDGHRAVDPRRLVQLAVAAGAQAVGAVVAQGTVLDVFPGRAGRRHRGRRLRTPGSRQKQEKRDHRGAEPDQTSGPACTGTPTRTPLAGVTFIHCHAAGRAHSSCLLRGRGDGDRIVWPALLIAGLVPAPSSTAEVTLLNTVKRNLGSPREARIGDATRR